MEKFKFRLRGVAPLIMHNERLANPRDPYAKALKPLTAKKNKTDEVLEQITKLEWRGGLYDVSGKIIMPSANIIACLVEGARKLKRGKDIESSVFAEEAFCSFLYDGPKSIEDLYADNKFLDYRGVVVNGKRIMRSRPIFHSWEVRGELVYDSEVINKDTMDESLEIAGLRIGLCDHRPQFGRFEVEK
jgi:hypothetical protein